MSTGAGVPARHFGASAPERPAGTPAPTGSLGDLNFMLGEGLEVKVSAAYSAYG